MSGSKQCIKVNKDEEKRLYSIMKDLEFYGESLIENATGSEWHSTMRKFGIRAKPLIEKELIEPIWIQRKPGNYIMENKLIRTKKSVLVKEASNGSSSRFYFETAEIEKYHKKRRRLI